MKPPYIPSSPVIDGKVNPYENSMVIYTFPSMTGDYYKIYKGHQGTRWVFGYPVELQRPHCDVTVRVLQMIIVGEGTPKSFFCPRRSIQGIGKREMKPIVTSTVVRGGTSSLMNQGKLGYDDDDDDDDDDGAGAGLCWTRLDKNRFCQACCHMDMFDMLPTEWNWPVATMM